MTDETKAKVDLVFRSSWLFFLAIIAYFAKEYMQDVKAIQRSISEIEVRQAVMAEKVDYMATSLLRLEARAWTSPGSSNK